MPWNTGCIKFFSPFNYTIKPKDLIPVIYSHNWDKDYVYTEITVLPDKRM